MAGAIFVGLISAYDHLIAFLHLTILGVQWIMEGIRRDEDKDPVDEIRQVPVILLSVATRFEAFPVGVSFGVLQTAVLTRRLSLALSRLSAPVSASYPVNSGNCCPKDKPGLPVG